MVTYVLAALFALFTGPTLAELDTYRANLRPLLDAMSAVESNSRDDATGDDGKAIGRLQLWRVYWADATGHAPQIGGTYGDCRTREYAERVVVAYWHRYARTALDSADLETLARVHNGGPKGAKRKATLGYWRKVQKILEKV
jgi:hypothetical protein